MGVCQRGKSKGISGSGNSKFKGVKCERALIGCRTLRKLVGLKGM